MAGGEARGLFLPVWVSCSYPCHLSLPSSPWQWQLPPVAGVCSLPLFQHLQHQPHHTPPSQETPGAPTHTPQAPLQLRGASSAEQILLLKVVQVSKLQQFPPLPTPGPRAGGCSCSCYLGDTLVHSFCLFSYLVNKFTLSSQSSDDPLCSNNWCFWLLASPWQIPVLMKTGELEYLRGQVAVKNLWGLWRKGWKMLRAVS